MTNFIFDFDGQDSISLTRFKIHGPYILLTKYSNKVQTNLEKSALINPNITMCLRSIYLTSARYLVSVNFTHRLLFTSYQQISKITVKYVSEVSLFSLCYSRGMFRVSGPLSEKDESGHEEKDPSMKTRKTAGTSENPAPNKLSFVTSRLRW